MHDFSYVVWDSDSDEHLGFVFPKAKVASFLRMAKKLDMNCYAFKYKKESASSKDIKLNAYNKLMTSYVLKKADQDINGFSIESIELNHDIKLHDLIVASVERANAIGYKPYLYISATWCEPCLDFFLALENQLMVNALQGVCLVMLDLDGWYDSLAQINIADISGIPTLVALDESGYVTDKVADFSLVEENTPNLLAKFLIPFFNG